MTLTRAERYQAARRDLAAGAGIPARGPDAAEGGCGVLGLAANTRIAGRHVLSASQQMHNRGNGKGGGIAMAGLDPAEMRVDRATLQSHTLLQIALLDPSARAEVEAQYITPHFDITQAYEAPHLDHFRAVDGLELRPPDVMRYFVRVRPNVLDRFATEKGLISLSAREIEDEFIYQNTFRLNQAFYASLGEKRAFVLSHGRDLIVLKIVGYAEQVVEYYCLNNQHAHVWIAHQRYPTKGRVWHPGGAHPFIGLNEALVHNGDFANYHAVSEYLQQRGMSPLFLTDTEVAVQLFDLWDRVYAYPLEATLEAMAPTTDHDFTLLPPDRQELYRVIQAAHIHGSPDGPWFFIVARSLPDVERWELLGITDTSMLRPQVFALYENSTASQAVQIGLIASERQAINACLRSLSSEDDRFRPIADRYWVARGGSHTDGGAFRFTVTPDAGLTCHNKFGDPVTVAVGRQHSSAAAEPHPPDASDVFVEDLRTHTLLAFDDGGLPTLWRWLRPALRTASWDELRRGLTWLEAFGACGSDEWAFSLDALTWIRDRAFDPGSKKRSSILTLIDASTARHLGRVPEPGAQDHLGVGHALRITWPTRLLLRPPDAGETTLVLDAADFPAEGDEAAARFIVTAATLGWRKIITYNWRGGRFAGCGLGPGSSDIRLDLYGDVGDYAGSGLDGAEIQLHGDGQDQLGQILRSGKLVVHGDVGQTFLYGAKGGEVYVRGSAAGRPLINAVGKPRVVINGTCLDYLAESFMAGDPLAGGGFVILNGMAFDDGGRLMPLDTPYPGGNLFSLASGGAIYLRDPNRKVQPDQLNGGAFARLSEQDWRLILPYLQENERQFGITLDDLLTVDGTRYAPADVYRKVCIPTGMVELETENR